jgi:uncharacterized membrane protein YozB (DUF420 family)
MALDPVGNISLILQIVILFLLVLGLPFFRGEQNQKNLMAHGHVTVVALILHTILIFIVMIPSFTSGFNGLGSLSLFDALTVWPHIVLGTSAEVLGLIIIGDWFKNGAKKMTCWKRHRWMRPTFVIWVISIINGTLIHVLGML